MPMSLPRFRLAVLFALLFACAAGPRLAADLVWRPDTGWQIEGGVLSGLVGQEGANALKLMNEARRDEEKGSRRSAIKLYNKVGKKYGNSVYAPEAYYRAAHLYLEGKRYDKAFESYQNVVGRYPNSSRFTEIIGEQYRIASALLDGARNRIFFGLIPGFKNREKAIEYFETILYTAPYSDYAPLSLMNVARAHQRLGNTDEAIDALDRMINNYSQSLLTSDAYIKLAQTHASLVDGPYYDQASTREAITYYEDFMILFPSDPAVSDAEKGLADMRTVLAQSKMKIADFYFFKRDNYKAARVFYNEAITVYPDSAVATKAHARLAEVDAAEAKTKAKASGEGGTGKKKRFFFF